jgi:hypothetical protein
LQKLTTCINRGLAAVALAQEQVREHVAEVQKIERTLNPQRGSSAKRQRRFERLQKRLATSGDPLCMQMAAVMSAFLAGLFVGGDLKGLPEDNLELERWFRVPKGHERRIHGHRHAGVRLVQEGGTLMLVLDAHQSHPGPFGVEELQSYRHAARPAAEQEALRRRKVMRHARSGKKRQQLLAELERRYCDCP